MRQPERHARRPSSRHACLGVLDHDASFRSDSQTLRREQKDLRVGFAAGDIPKVPINLILLKSCQVVGVFYGTWAAREPAENDANFAQLLEWFEAGKLKPVICANYPLAEAAAALRHLSNRQAIGKVVVDIR